MIYVCAPNHQQAHFWLREFGTNLRDREVLVLALPNRSGEVDARVPAGVRGRRWKDGDEWLLVGDRLALDWPDVEETAHYLGVPKDVSEREWESLW